MMFEIQIEVFVIVTKIRPPRVVVWVHIDEIKCEHGPPNVSFPYQRNDVFDALVRN